MKEYFYSHFWALVASYASALLVASWFLLRRFPQWMRSVHAEGWPLSQGRIETVGVKTFREQALAELGYSYVVQGERYAGYYSRQFADEQHAWDYADGLKGQLVVVRYKENDPEVSALRSEDQQSLADLTRDGFFSSFFRAMFERIRELYPRRL